MDNFAIGYAGVQHYRAAVIKCVRERVTRQRGRDAAGRLKGCFAGEWSRIAGAAEELRKTERGTSQQDDFDVLRVEDFPAVFRCFFVDLCPHQAKRPRKEQAQALGVLTEWAERVKHLSDPTTRPAASDGEGAEVYQILDSARHVLDFLNLPEVARTLLELQRKLHDLEPPSEQVLTYLPPEDEVVTDFVGRTEELAKLQKWLADPGARRWALSGEGGTGKSAIAYRFARQVAARTDHGLAAVIWVSAKRRRFIQGQTILIDRPDFWNLPSALERIIVAYGWDPSDHPTVAAKREFVVELARECPALFVVDDIDSLDQESNDAMEFLLMDLPANGRCRVLITSRRGYPGVTTTQVPGFRGDEGEEFIRSRCALRNMDADLVMPYGDTILQTTDGSPLFIEDLLRLTRVGLDIPEAIGLWKKKRGTPAREYALKREYDQLSRDAQQLLLALSLMQASCRFEDVRRVLDWTTDQLIDAAEELQRMFLMPVPTSVDGTQRLTLNQNTKALVLSYFGGTQAYERMSDLVLAVAGALDSTRKEKDIIGQQLQRAIILIRDKYHQEAQDLLKDLLNRFPAQGVIYATLGRAYKVDGRVADARDMFQRAHELNCRDLGMYLHWAELEADQSEWKKSQWVAEKGLKLDPKDPALHHRLGYALSRLAQEAYEKHLRSGRVTHEALYRKAVEHLTNALRPHPYFSDKQNRNRVREVYRTLVSTADLLADKQAAEKYMWEWEEHLGAEAANDPEFQTLRKKYFGRRSRS